MSPRNYAPRILAIDLRLKRLGYVVFEGPRQLLDWGGRGYPTTAMARKRVADLLRAFRPSVIVIRKERRTGVRNNAGIAAILRSIKSEAKIYPIPVYLITPEEIVEAFSIFRVENKDDVASILATAFPELLWKLPPKRRSWKTEHFRMIVFDAIAAGFAHYRRSGTQVPPPE